MLKGITHAARGSLLSLARHHALIGMGLVGAGVAAVVTIAVGKYKTATTPPNATSLPPVPGVTL